MLTRIKKVFLEKASSHCASCKVCRYAERKSDSTLAGFIRWHQSWCPAYSAFKKQLELIDTKK